MTAEGLTRRMRRHTICHTNLKIGQVDRQFTSFPTFMMPESGRIRLVRPSAVIITHKK